VLELLIVLGLVFSVSVVAIVPWPSLLITGAVTTGAGLVFGVATGLWYHIALARELAPTRALPPRWWLRPAALHERLGAADRRRVMPLFHAGAAGFFVTVAGLALVILGLAVAVWRSP